MGKKRLRKKAIALATVCGMIFSSIPVSAAGNSTTDSEMILWYDEPATETNSYDTWQQATLPIGNGILGANVYGELSKEHLTINEETLWSGGRGSVSDYNGGNPSSNKVSTYENYATALLKGKTVSNIEELAGVSAESSGYYNGYQPLGDLYINFENAPNLTPSDYTRTLDLEEGISTVSYNHDGVSYNRTYFASNPDNVIVSRLTASGAGNLDLTVSFESKQVGEVTASVDGAAAVAQVMSLSNFEEDEVTEEETTEEETVPEEETTEEETVPEEETTGEETTPEEEITEEKETVPEEETTEEETVPEEGATEEETVPEEKITEEEETVPEEGATEEETVPEEGATEEETVPKEGATAEETVPEEMVLKKQPEVGIEPIEPVIVQASNQVEELSDDTSRTGRIVCSGTVSNNGLLHNTQIIIEADAGAMTANADGSIDISDANEVTIYLTAATDYENTFYDDAQTTAYYYRTGETEEQLSERVEEKALRAAKKGYDAVLEAHTADYKNLYNRVALDLGQANSKTTDALLSAYQSGNATTAEQRYLEVLLYQYGRYLLIAGSRENSQLPTTLQGIWNNNTAAPWYSDIHTNINEQMNYWLSNNCNLTECALPLVEYMKNLEIPGGRTVKIYTGSTNGIMAHTQNTPYGYTSPGWSISTWGWSPAAATWLLQNCYDYYEYSGDTDTLKNTIYPMLKEQVLMYEDLLKEYNGRLVMPITQSPELATITAGNTYEQSLIWQLYADTIEAAEVLGLDSGSIAKWKSTMDQLKPIEIGTSGQVKEWYTETSINSVNDTSSHRHLSNLLGLYPGNLFDTQEEINAAVVSLNNKNFGRVGTHNNPEGGWTYGQLINSWARVGNGENAYFSVKTMIQNRLYDNLWDWHTYNSNGAFQIDGNYGYSAGVGEMLLQSNLGYINLLPAIPSVWSDGSVEGLLAEGGFEVDMDWTNKELTNVSITSKNGGSCSVKNWTGETMTVLDANGNKVETSYEDGVCTFDTKAGNTYIVKSEALPQINASASRNEDGTITLKWEAQEGVTYTIKRRTIQ